MAKQKKTEVPPKRKEPPRSKGKARKPETPLPEIREVPKVEVKAKEVETQKPEPPPAKAFQVETKAPAEGESAWKPQETFPTKEEALKAVAADRWPGSDCRLVEI